MKISEAASPTWGSRDLEMIGITPGPRRIFLTKERQNGDKWTPQAAVLFTLEKMNFQRIPGDVSRPGFQIGWL